MPRILFQVRHAGKIFQLLEGEFRHPRSGNPQKCILYLVNVKQSFADRFVGQRCRMRLKRSPVLGVSPFLVRIKLVKV